MTSLGISTSGKLDDLHVLFSSTWIRFSEKNIIPTGEREFIGKTKHHFTQIQVENKHDLKQSHVYYLQTVPGSRTSQHSLVHLAVEGPLSLQRLALQHVASLGVILVKVLELEKKNNPMVIVVSCNCDIWNLALKLKLYCIYKYYIVPKSVFAWVYYTGKSWGARQLYHLS